MEQQVSLYRDLEELAIVFYNKNILPHVNVPHLHSQYEFYYNIKGGTGLFADKKFYECTGHDLFLIPKTCVHKVLVPKDTYYERCIINMDSRLVDAINVTPSLNRPLLWLEGLGEPETRKVNLNVEQHEQFLKMVEAYSALKEKELLQYAKLLEILAFLGEQFPIGKECMGETRQAVSIPEQALAVIEEDFKTIRISDISYHKHFVEILLHDFAGKGCGCGFSVGSGNTDKLTAGYPVCQFNFAPDRNFLCL